MLRVACPVGFVRGIVHAREVLVIAHGRAMERLSPPLHDRGGVNSFMCGLCCGLSAMASGYGIGVIGESSVRANAINEDFYVGMILMLIFAEAIGLFGLIIAIILSSM